MCGGILLITVGYIRVSREEQADSQLSLEAQRRQIEAYCQYKGLNLTHFYSDDAVSGGKPLNERPSGGQMFEKIGNGEIKAIVATKLDRMFRNTLDCLLVEHLVQQKGVTLHLLDLNVDTSTAIGKAFLTIAAAFAELELNRGKERTRDALASLKVRGVALGGTPYGSRQDMSNGGRTFLEDTAEQQAIELMIRLRSAGLTYETIANELNDAGLPTKRGKRIWKRATVRRIIMRESENEGRPETDELSSN